MVCQSSPPPCDSPPCSDPVSANEFHLPSKRTCEVYFDANIQVSNDVNPLSTQEVEKLLSPATASIAVSSETEEEGLEIMNCRKKVTKRTLYELKVLHGISTFL